MTRNGSAASAQHPVESCGQPSMAQITSVISPARIQCCKPDSTLVTWQKDWLFRLASLPSQQITWPIHHEVDACVVAPMITKWPGADGGMAALDEPRRRDFGPQSWPTPSRCVHLYS